MESTPAKYSVPLKYGIPVLLVACALAFSGGMFLAPRQVVEVEKFSVLDLKTEDITKGMTFAKTVEITRWKNVKATTTTTPDGGTTTIVEDHSIEHEGSTENRTEAEAAHVDQSHKADSEKTKTVTLQPKWRVGGSVGASAVPPWLPITGPLVIGVEGDYRLIGGVFVGLRLNTVGTASLAVSGELP